MRAILILKVCNVCSGCCWCCCSCKSDYTIIGYFDTSSLPRVSIFPFHKIFFECKSYNSIQSINWPVSTRARYRKHNTDCCTSTSAVHHRLVIDSNESHYGELFTNVSVIIYWITLYGLYWRDNNNWLIVTDVLYFA